MKYFIRGGFLKNDASPSGLRHWFVSTITDFGEAARQKSFFKDPPQISGKKIDL